MRNQISYCSECGLKPSHCLHLLQGKGVYLCELLNCLNSKDLRFCHSTIGRLARFLALLLGFIFWPLGLVFSLCFSFQVPIMEAIVYGFAAICCCICDKRVSPQRNVEKLAGSWWRAFCCCPCFVLVLAILLVVSSLINLALCLALTLLAVFPVYSFLIFYFSNYFRYHIITKFYIERRQRKARRLKNNQAELQIQE